MNRKPRQLKELDLRQQIEKLLSKNPKTRYNLKQIARKINAANPYEAIFRNLGALIAERKVIKLSADRYKWDERSANNNPSNKSSKKVETILYTGIVDMTRSGAAYIINSESVEDIYVNSKHLKGALHKDEVTVEVNAFGRGRKPEGKVVSIEKRALRRVIGHISLFKNYGVLTPDNTKLYPEVLVNFNDTMGCNNNDRVVVEITQYGKGQNRGIWGKVINILEDISDIEMNMQSILLSNGFDIDFPPEVLDEIATINHDITVDEINKRRDLRTVTTFTIDPLSAKDFDDALSYNVLENGNIEVGVHIADVSHYIKEGSPLDKEAFRRSTSVYLVDRVCPMLPEVLSNDLCSLNPHEDKLTYSAMFVFDAQKTIVDQWFGRTVIHSNRRFTYEEAQEIITTGIGDYSKELIHLNELAQYLRKERFNEGAINFDSDELQFVLDEEGNPMHMYKKQRFDAHMLVEDFMLLANKKVAQYVGQKSIPEIPMIYRVHDLPNPEKLADFADFAAQLGFKFNLDTPQNIIRSFNDLESATKENELLTLLQPLAIRTMSKAIYTTNNIGHYGLGFEYYTHFTSPIRRYADIIVHRILDKNLKSEYRADISSLEQMAKHVSDQEKKANEAERESNKYYQTLYISKFIGQSFDGVVSGIIEKGIFVELIDTKVEGLLTFDSMGQVFEVSSSKLRAKSRISGDEFTMGQRIKVKILAADPESRRTDMELVMEE